MSCRATALCLKSLLSVSCSGLYLCVCVRVNDLPCVACIGRMCRANYNYMYMYICCWTDIMSDKTKIQICMRFFHICV